MSRNPDSAWVTQQARNLAVGERLGGVRFVIRERDTKFSGPFDEVFRSEGARIIQDPGPSSEGERSRRAVGTHRAAGVHGLDAGARAPTLERVLRTCEVHYNHATPHRGLELKSSEPRPDPGRWPAVGARVRTHAVLGGLIREYEVAT